MRWVKQWAPIALLVFALWWVPSVASPYYLQLSVEIIILALYATSYNLLLGYGGMLSLGHAAYFGLGAYTVALLAKKLAVTSFFGSLAAAMLVASVGAVVIGYFCVRLSQVYFTMLTLAFAEMLHALASRWYGMTNGDTGITGLPRVILSNLDFSAPPDYYRLVLLVIVPAIYLLWRVVQSPFGLAIRTIRENPKRSAFLGINVHLHQLAAFVIAGAFAGLAGGLFAWYEHAVFPDYVQWGKSAEAVTVTILGGHGVFLGPALGSVLILLLETLVRRYSEYWSLYLGVILVGLVFFPGGVAGYAGRWTKRRSKGGLGRGHRVEGRGTA